MRTPTRRDSSDVIASELTQLLRQEMIGGMRGMFEDLLENRSGGGLQVVINNNTAAQVTGRETGAINQKQLEITIDQMVANSLLQGRQTSGVLKNLFGLVPTLSGR